MSDRGPGPGRFERPKWILPIAVIGALLILVGIILAIDWNGSDGSDPGPRVTGTTQPG